MYYVHVLSALLAHNHGVYAHFFRIQHHLPPYSLYYYALLLLSRFVPMLLADRVLVCAYLVSSLLGFRYAARALGPSADTMTLLLTPLLLNWPLGMGFVNFCLSLSFALWGLGVWLRMESSRSWPLRVSFVALATACMLTHPVPLLLLLVLAGALFATRLLRSNTRRSEARRLAPDAITFGVAALNLLYVRHFVISHPLRQVEAPASFLSGVVQRSRGYLAGHGLLFVVGNRSDVLLYRASLYVILLVAILLALRQCLRHRAARMWTYSDTLFLLAVLLTLSFPLLPPELNGSFFFADRLLLCVWLLFLLAASGFDRRLPASVQHTFQGTSSKGAHRVPSGLAWVAIPFALVANGALLLAANHLLRPAAEAIAAMDRKPLVPPGAVGVLMEDPRPPRGDGRGGLAWNPYKWALVHQFRRSDAVLANPPWADVTILPVGPTEALPESQIRALQEPFPTEVQGALLQSPEDLRRTLAVTDFFFVNQADRPPPGTPEPLLSTTPGATTRSWHCTDKAWYRLCTATPR